MRRPLALAAVLAAVAAAPASAGEGGSKIDNALARPLAASEAQFVQAALVQPTSGSCEALSPDPGFVEEMLVRFGEGNAKTYERRVAFVVGNGAYRNITPPLPNPPNDATSMAKMLRALGFTVYRAIDATERSLDDCFTKFSGDLEGKRADIALFFYAGHGLQLTSTEDNEKRNYMVTVDGDVDRTTGQAKGFRQIDKVLTEMRKHSKQAVFLYDACRNAPYGEGVVKDVDGHAVRAWDAASGPAPVAELGERASQAGLFIAYATSPGKVAKDDTAGSTHSPFTEALLQNLPTPGVTIGEALDSAFYDVGDLTGGQQTPWTSSSLQERLRLNGEITSAEAEVNSDRAAGLAAAYLSQKLKRRAIVAALAGLPDRWPSADAFAASKAALYRSIDAKDFYLEHTKMPPRQAVFDAKNGEIVTNGPNGVARYDYRTGAEIRAQKGEVWSKILALSADGSRLIMERYIDGGSELAFVRTGDLSTIVAIPLSQSCPTRAGKLSNDGSRALLWCSGQAGVRVYDAAAGRPIAEITNDVSTAALSPDGAAFAAVRWGPKGTNGEAKVYDSATGRPLLTLPEDVHREVAFSPDGKIVAVSNLDGGVNLWKILTGERVNTANLIKSGDRLTAIAFSHDGLWLGTGDGSGRLNLWDLATGYRVASEQLFAAKFGTLSNEVRDIAFSHDNATVLAVSALGVAHWRPLEPNRSKARAPGFIRAVAENGASALAIDPDDRTKLFVVDVATGRTISTLTAPETIDIADISTDGNLVLTAKKYGGDSVLMWRASDGSLLKTLHVSDVMEASFFPGGASILTLGGSVDATVLSLWPIDGSAAPTVFSIRNALSASFDTTGRRIAIRSRDSVKIWDAAQSQAISEATGGDFWTVALSPGGEKILLNTIGTRQTAQILRVETNEMISRLVGHQGSISSAQFSGDGSKVLTNALDFSARIWDPDSGALLKTLDGQGFLLAGDALAVTKGVTLTVHEMLRWGTPLLAAAGALIAPEDRAEVERERIRYWEVDPALLQ